MSAPNDGGSAFPHADFGTDGLYHPPSAGMSLLDYFAGQALPAVIADHVAKADGGEIDRKDVAVSAYLIAEEMIAFRSVPRSPEPTQPAAQPEEDTPW